MGNRTSPLPLKSETRIRSGLVEVLEYTLVILVSVMVIGFSFSTYSAYTASITSAGERATYSSVVGLAYAAIEQGSSAANITLNRSSVTCVGGRLAFASPAYSASSTLPATCDFEYVQLSGPHQLSFVFAGGVLTLGVS